jgi:2-polyprenyl-3-methyl-5-hydroxy-6-metoxy-1,4-benzoquinol methylase
MDDPQLPEDEHHAALAGLARINRATRVAPAIYRRIKQYARVLGRPIRLLDIATGSGDLPIDWTKLAARDGLKIHCTGLDISHAALEYARMQAASAKCDVQFIQRDVLNDRLPTGYDVITCDLFIHHLDERQIVHLLSSMQAVAGHAMIVCDLERSWLNLACVWLASQALTRSKVVHVDAVRSVYAALTREEFLRLAEKALDRPLRVVGLPPCRFIATLDESVVRSPEGALAGLQSA